MATKKSEASRAKKPAAKPVKAMKQTAAAKKPPEKQAIVKKTAPVPAAGKAAPVIPVAPKPDARTCPLVLDGMVLARDFSARDCLSCDEFDCRFYAGGQGSGALRSRLFASAEDDGFGDDDDDGGFGGFYGDEDDTDGRHDDGDDNEMDGEL